MPPHLVHLSVQYSDPDLPAMTRRIASGALHCGQLDSTAAEGDWVGSASVSSMGCGHFPVGSSCGSLPLRHLVCRVSPELEPLDLNFGIRDGGSGISPCEADFERGKRNPVDDDGLPIRPPDAGVPQTCSSLERFDLKAIMGHWATPEILRSQASIGRSN
jgi:hypothetical protein